MYRPNGVAVVQRVLGFANYLTKFVSGLSNMCEPLRKLTKTDVDFVCTDTADRAFTALKTAISEATILEYFDSRPEITLQCGTLQTGLCCVLM